MLSTARLIVVVGLILTAGCGEKPSTGSDAGRADAGALTDGGAPADAGTRTDAGAPTDAGSTCTSGLFFADGGCAPGCLDGDACPSGVCFPSHDCLSCREDKQCTDGKRCGTGTCHARCETEATCPAGWRCSDGRCVDPSRDVLHCGSTGPCSGGAFCAQGQCRDAVLSNACHPPLVRVVLDGQPTDDEAGAAIATALVTACCSGVPLVVGTPADAGVLDVRTGEPLRAGELLVVAGGSFFQAPMRWLSERTLLPVVDRSTQTEVRYEQRDAGLICSRPTSTISSTHDVFLIELATAPSGAVVLNAAGYYGEGTEAAAWYVIHRLFPDLRSQTSGWYVVEWTDNPDGGVSGGPDALDTWTPLASGT